MARKHRLVKELDPNATKAEEAKATVQLHSNESLKQIAKEVKVQTAQTVAKIQQANIAQLAKQKVAGWVKAAEAKHNSTKELEAVSKEGVAQLDEKVEKDTAIA